MTYVYLNERATQDLIDGLNAYAGRMSDCQADVVEANAAAGSVVDLGVLDLDSLAEKVKGYARGLQDRLDAAIAANSSGITFGQGGMIAYYIPDGYEDTAGNARHFNTDTINRANSDAATLRGLHENGGTAEQWNAAQTSVAEMTDDPNYSQLLVQGVGIEIYLALPIDAQKAYCYQEYTQENVEGAYKPRSVEDGEQLDALISALGCGLAGASMNDSNGQLLQQIVAAYDRNAANDPSQNKVIISGLDALMSVPQAEYDTTFIVKLAEQMEERVDVNDEYSAPTSMNVSPDDYFVGASPNPMAGPLSAMGNNPEAALEYLTPSDKNPAMVVDPDGTLTVPLEGSEYDPDADHLTSTGRHTTGRQRMDLLLSMKDADKESLTAALSGGVGQPR